MSSKSLSRLALVSLVYVLLVVVWGAYVRATGSGAGCGRHWPLCNGEALLRQPSIETLIEYSHRVTSGLSLILVVALLIGTWRSSSCSRDAKRWAVVAAGFIFVEAGIGAALVLFELVKENASGFRAVMIAVHLANSFGLIGALALCWWSMTFPERIVGFTKKGLLSVCAMLLVGMAGAITALGDTLFPAMTHSDSMSLSSPFLVQLRIIHPLLAVLLGVWLLIRAFELGSENGQERLWKRTTLVLLFVQYGVGILSVALKVPVCLQLIHLLLADLLWVSVLFCEQLIFLESSLKNTKSTDPIIYRGQYL